MNVYLDWALTILWWISYPIGFVLYYLAVSVLFVAKLLYHPLAIILQPLVYLLRFILICCALPFQFLAKLEPLYNFLGVAALVGIVIGLGVSLLYRQFDDVLDLDFAMKLLPGASHKRGKPRTAKEYRRAKAKRYAEIDSPLHSPGYLSLSDSIGLSGKQRKGRGLLTQTILEEVSSDY